MLYITVSIYRLIKRKDRAWKPVEESKEIIIK